MNVSLAGGEQMNRTTLVVAAFLVVIVTACLAGESWEYKCVNPKCKYAGSLAIGDGIVFKTATGYCMRCKEFVSIRWKREGLTGVWKQSQDRMTNLVENAPQKLGTVWSPITGITANLYPCPQCKEAFMDFSIESIMIDERLERRFCPRCMKPTLTMEKHGTTD